MPSLHPSAKPSPKLGFFGGSFDPLHRGHLELARCVTEQMGLERLYFVPAAQNPHKPTGPIASGELRLQMIRATIASEPTLGVIDWELNQPPPSYTRRTVAHLEKTFPDAALHWLIGADQLPALAQWQEIESLAKVVTFILLARPGTELIKPAINGLRIQQVKTPLFDLSSTHVRAQLAAGLPIDNLVPDAVLAILNSQPHPYHTI